MPRVEQSVIVNRPVADVFDFAGRDYVKNHRKWSPATKEFRQTTPGGMKVGTTIELVREIRGKPTSSTEEITEYEPDKSLAFKSAGQSSQATGRYTFEPVDGGTKVTFVLDATVGGFGKLAGPIISREMGKEIEADLSRMKSLLEQ